MNPLVIIPARKGSKGVPFKNKRILGNKALIEYTIQAALNVFPNENICISTDDEDIIDIARKNGLDPKFIRPDYLSNDSASSYDVIMHAIEFYEHLDMKFDTVILLQATSPFRNANHIKEALKLYSSEIDMVVSVCESKYNPYYNLFELGKEGYLKKSKKGNYTRRQDCPKVYEYNGAIYIMNKESLKRESIISFSKIVKFEMKDTDSHDIDTEFDWLVAEEMLKKYVYQDN